VHSPMGKHAGMDANEPATLVLLESKGDRLRVTARQHVVPGQDESWFDIEFTATGHPFAGVVTDVVTATDLEFWRHNVGRLAAPGEVVFGVERAAELVLRVEDQVGGEPGSWTVQVTLTPSADDPYPSLTWLLFDQRPFVEDFVRALDGVLSTK
jgi:hypothetical protein